MTAAKNILLRESATWASMAAQAAMAKGTAKKKVDFGGRKLKELVVKVENKNKQEQP